MSSLGIAEFAKDRGATRLQVRRWIHAGMPHFTDRGETLIATERALYWLEEVEPSLNTLFDSTVEGEDVFLRFARTTAVSTGEGLSTLRALGEHVERCATCYDADEDNYCRVGRALNEAWWVVAFRVEARRFLVGRGELDSVLSQAPVLPV